MRFMVGRESLETQMLGVDCDEGIELTEIDLEQDPPLPSSETSLGSECSEVFEVLERERLLRRDHLLRCPRP